MANVSYPNTLISSDMSGKIANSDNLYDKSLDKFQQELNRLLFKEDGSLNPNLDKTELEKTVSSLSTNLVNITSAINSMSTRITNLENRDTLNNIIGVCDEDGFFIVDTYKRIGACITYNDGKNIYCGWDGTPLSTPLSLSEANGGYYIMLDGADFSNMNIGTLGTPTDSLTNIIFDYPVIDGNTVTIHATPVPNTYAGGLSWWVAQNSTQYISFVSENKSTNTATFLISSQAKGVTVTVYCGGTTNSVTNSISFPVTYEADVIDLVSLDIVWEDIKDAANSSTNPMTKSNFKLVAVPTPDNAEISTGGYYWSVVSGQDYLTVSSGQGTTTPTFTITSSAITTQECIVKCEAYDVRGNHKEATFRLYVKKGLSTLEGIRLNNYSSEQKTKSQQLEVSPVPSSASLGTVEYSVDQGNAEISNTGNLTIDDNSVKGETILVTAKALNPNYDGTSATEEYFSVSANITNNYDMPLQKLTISPGNVTVMGQKVYLRAIPTPYSDVAPSVTWEIVNTGIGSKMFSISSDGVLTIPNKTTTYIPLKVRATSTVDTSISAEATLMVKYDDRNTTSSLLQVANPGGTKVSFGAVKTFNNSRYHGQDVTNNVTWEILSTIVDAANATTQFNKAAEESSTPATAPSISNLLPVNMAIQEGVAPDINLTLDYFAQIDIDELIGPSQGPTTNSFRSPVAGATYPAFGEDDPNVLYLNPEAEGPQVITVRCTYEDPDTGDTLTHTVAYSFTYDATKKAVETLEFKDVPDFITYDSTNQKYTFTAPIKNKWYNLRDYVQPKLLTGETVEDYMFDASKVGFVVVDNATDQKYDDTYCYCNSSGRFYINSGVDHDVVFKLCYAYIGELPNWVYQNAVDKANTGEEEDPEWYYPADNRQEHLIDARLYRASNERIITATSISIRCSELYTSSTSGAIVDGGSLSVLDQNGQILKDQNGQIVYATYSVTEGKEYCSVDTNGRVMRIYDPNNGGAVHRVTVKAAVEGTTLKATASFNVQIA